MRKSRILFDGDTIKHGGREFTVEFPYDDSSRCPWEDCDGHGIVSDWVSRDKAPGERLLHSDQSSKRYYDFAETIKIAKRDGWGLGKDDESKLAQALGRAPTRKEIIAQAVENDFDYLRRWCNDDWTYVGVVVKHESGRTESLWGIESDAYDYLADVARECAAQICHELDTEMAQEIQDSRPDLAPTY